MKNENKDAFDNKSQLCLVILIYLTGRIVKLATYIFILPWQFIKATSLIIITSLIYEGIALELKRKIKNFLGQLYLINALTISTSY